MGMSRRGFQDELTKNYYQVLDCAENENLRDEKNRDE